VVGCALLGASAAGLLAATPATQAASSAAHAAASNSICAKVSPAAVSAIVGYKVPAPVQNTLTEKATPNNFEISSVETSCTYGTLTSLAGLKKTVLLDLSVASKAITESEVLASVKKAEAISKTLKFKLTPYSGLGVPGYFLTSQEPGVGIDTEVMSGLSGKDGFGAAVYSGSFPESKLAELAKLAEKL
jgi:hypothetical protein